MDRKRERKVVEVVIVCFSALPPGYPLFLFS